MIPTIFAVGIIIGNRVQAVLAQLFQSKLLLVKMERMAVCAFEAGQRHEYECRKCMYVKGQAGSGRHNTCIVVERKKEDGCMNECGNVEAIDLSGRRRYARRFVRYLFSKKCANVNDVNVPNNLFPLFYFVFSTIIESSDCSLAYRTMLKCGYTISGVDDAVHVPKVRVPLPAFLSLFGILSP